jgi:pSer/pThr/pTyr-binding forkhead associated (FHA) protein
MFKLIIQDDEGKTTVVPLIRDEITIGRKEGNTIRLTERNVSRKHARIVKSNGSVVVEDLDSYNGVKVNGTRIQGRVPVNESDRIQIGDYLLELKVDRGAQPGDSTLDGMGAMSGAPSLAAHTPPPTPMGAANGGVHSSSRSLKPTAPMPPAQAAAVSHPSAEAPRGDAAPVAAENPGRLVVVSANFGGREFVLDKATMVIGRTDDNDIVVNHRSISRHHAKIVLEQGRYCIVDMQSSNGVRVNGEEYGKVELRRGDMIDLGHVRLRYVEPGEDFVFDRDAQLVDVATRSGKGRGALMAVTVMGVVVAGAAVAAFFVLRGPPGTGSTVAVNDKPPADQPKPVAEPPQPAAKTVIDAGTAVAVAPATQPAVVEPASQPAAVPSKPKEDPAKLLEESRQRLAEEKWLDAYAAAEKALTLDPSSDEAKKLEEQAHAEFANEQTYQRFTEARSAGRLAEALKTFGQIPKTSSYHAKAETDVATMHDQYVQARVDEAKAFAARGQCDKILALARRSGDVFPDAKGAVEKAGAKCVTSASASPPAPEAPPNDGKPPAELSDAEVQKLIEDAREAAKNTAWTDARKKAEEVLRVRPGDQDALVIAGMAACNLTDKERAVKYINRLKGTRQNMMKQICATKGVLIE